MNFPSPPTPSHHWYSALNLWVGVLLGFALVFAVYRFAQPPATSDQPSVPAQLGEAQQVEWLRWVAEAAPDAPPPSDLPALLQALPNAPILVRKQLALTNSTELAAWQSLCEQIACTAR
ncbi:MAG TPA: hypothetical protein PK299_16050 [Anaerolineales bacterium]|nr:hypothetical protein [Anaerolineales bacterium]